MPRPMRTALATAFLAALSIAAFPAPQADRPADFPRILTVREQAAAVNRMTLKRLDSILPQAMAEAGLDMWLIVSQEDNLDPVFRTMIPYDTWCPITQILALCRRPDGAVERFNLSRTDMKGLHKDAWDWRAWDKERKEAQWDALARLVKEKNPRRIGINESDEIWAAGGLTSSLKARLVKVLGADAASRFVSAETAAVRWLETLTEDDIAAHQAVAVAAHALIGEIFSNRVVTPGTTTLDDILYAYCQRVADRGLKMFAWPSLRIRGRGPQAVERYGAADTVVRPGDLIQIDTGIEYLRMFTDHCEWAYVLRPGETDAPAGVRALLAEANRLQDVFLAELRPGRTGNEILAAILASARAAGIPKPKIYSHSIGLYLHEPGPLIGLPWEQVDTGRRGEVKLVTNSSFAVELSVAGPVPEWNGRELTMAQEQNCVVTAQGPVFLDGRQTRLYLIR